MSTRGTVALAGDGNQIEYHVYHETTDNTYHIEIGYRAGHDYINHILPKEVALDLAERLERQGDTQT